MFLLGNLWTIALEKAPAFRCGLRARARVSALTVILVLLAAPAPALAGWKTFTTADGLPDNIVHAVIEDDEETLWFATWSGLSHFDGVHWRTYTRADGLVSDSLTCAFKAGDSSLWFGAQGGGVSRFANGSLRTYTFRDGLGPGTVWSISEDRSGRIWFATMEGGATWFDGATWGKLPGLATESIHCVFEDHAGDLWIGTHNAGVYRCTGSACTQITRSNSPLLSNDVRSIEEDAQHRLWFATNIGVSTLDSRGSWATYTIDGGLAVSNIYKVFQDRAGMMWFVGPSREGISRFDGRWWRRYDELEGYFLRTSIYSVMQDRSGNLWFSTSEGAARFDGAEMKTFPEIAGLGDAIVLGVFEDRRGSIWFGTQGSSTSGVFEYDGENWTSYPELAGAAVVRPIQDSAGNYWFPHLIEGGLTRLDPQGRWRTFTTADGLASDNCAVVMEDRHHNIWVDGGAFHNNQPLPGAISRYDGSSWVAITHESTGGGLASDNVFGLLEDRDGAIWVGTGADGVCRMDSLGNWKTFTTADGLGSNFVLGVTQDRDGYLWAFTQGAGLSRFLGEPTPDGVQRITTADGLRNNAVFWGTQTGDGNMWFTFDQGGGVMRWDGTDWRGLTSEDGVPNGSCHFVLEDHAGDLWITTNRGVARYGRDYVPPRTVIPQRPPGVSGSRSQSALFTALGESNRLEFSYRLDGGAWSDWSSINGWSAQNLPDGIHVLEVRSRDYWTNVDSTPEVATFEIDATPPVPEITVPAPATAVQGVVEIRGTASDARFKTYQVLARPSGVTSWDSPAATVIVQSATPVVDGALAVWSTIGLPDGVYDIRVSVADSLGLAGVAQVSVVVDNNAPFASETTPAKVTAALGGDVFTTNAEAHLYFPPHAFLEDAVVIVTPVDRGSVADTLAMGAVLVDPGYEFAWSGGSLEKPARLRMSYAGGTGAPTGALALYHSANRTDWERLGGTASAEERVIEVAIERPGFYALFADQGAPSGPRTVSGLAFTPRVFSPTGGYADREVGISFTLGRPGVVTVRVYNRAGRLVREVASAASLGAGMNVIRWDGSDRSGLMVPDGIYVVTVEAFGEAQKKPLAVIR